MKYFEKGNNSAMTNRIDKKKSMGLLNFILYPHTKYQGLISNGSWPCASVTDRRTDRQAQTNVPPQLLRSLGHNNMTPQLLRSWGIKTLLLT